MFTYYLFFHNVLQSQKYLCDYHPRGLKEESHIVPKQTKLALAMFKWTNFRFLRTNKFMKFFAKLT